MVRLARLPQMICDHVVASVYRPGWAIRYEYLRLPKSSRRQKRLFVLAHYADNARVHPYVYFYLNAMREAGCDTLVISAAGSLRAKDIERLQASNIGLVIRNNIGYDFGSWRAALHVYPTLHQDYSTVIFANDSVYGPFGNINDTLNRMEQAGHDVWGMTSSMECGYHLQSYFWALSKKALNSGLIEYFWHHYYRHHSRRQAVINRYELKLAQIAKRRFGLRATAVYAGRGEDGDSLSAENPTLHTASPLLCQHGVPFIKRELFKLRLLEQKAQDELVEVAGNKNAECCALMLDHLASQSMLCGIDKRLVK
ncbi:MAG: rhamnan synthesis F family protein [Spongiibacteraceae bacterium]|jgi:lipopolysaccharide biosynthesis protein|nr:rhamnan synthesis F family protein [Spongiibacteraceae bacterium]